MQIPIAAVQLIAGWLGEIGVPVTVTQLDSGALTACIAAPATGGGGWNLLISDLSPSPHDLLVIGSSKGIGYMNKAYWTNEKFDKLLSEIEVTTDLKKSQDLVDQAARLIYAEAPYIMLATPSRSTSVARIASRAGGRGHHVGVGLLSIRSPEAALKMIVNGQGSGTSRHIGRHSPLGGRDASDGNDP